MSRKAPEVVEGHRTPDNAAQRTPEGLASVFAQPPANAGNLIREQAAADGASAVPVPSQRFRFASNINGLRLSVRELHAPRFDEEQGKMLHFSVHQVQFAVGEYVTDDPKLADLIRRHPRFNQTFWDADEAAVAAKRAYAEDVLRKVDELPEDVKEQLRVRLGSKEFELPPAAAAG